MNELKLGVGLAHEFEITARKAGWTTEDFVRLAQSEALSRDLLAVVRGQAEVQIVTHTINCSVEPFIPDGWEIHPEDQIASRFTDSLIWDPTKVKLHLDPDQEGDGFIEGRDLQKKLVGQPVLPANVLDYLLDHPELIPESWKGKYVHFWGTVYRGEDGDLGVRCLCWDDGHWRWFGGWLDGGWGGQFPVLVRELVL